jgi:hypothetical protein
MAPRLVHFGAIESPLNPCFGRHVKQLAPAPFAVVSTHQPALGLRGGSCPVLLMCVIHSQGLCLSSGDIDRLMMIKRIWTNWLRLECIDFASNT